MFDNATKHSVHFTFLGFLFLVRTTLRIGSTFSATFFQEKMSSSTMRGSSARALGEASCRSLVRRMINLPRTIIDECSRVIDQGKGLIRIGSRRRPENLHSQQPLNFPFQDPSFFPPTVQEEWAFLASFEQQYGTTHPFFYACRFKDAMKIAADEHKFMFMYIHSPEHPFTPSFCRETLCSEIVVQFLDANFISWGGLASGGEGLQMANALRACTFPFCAVVAPASGDDNLSVLQQMEGPVSPAELVEMLQTTMEEQGVGKKEEKRRADLQLREEQDAAYAAALKIDQAKERLRKKPNAEANGSKKLTEPTQILIRFPNGERRENGFLCTDEIRAVYDYIDSLGLTGAGNYRLISNFPRKVYGEDEMGMSLKDAGLHPKASLFLELI